MDGYKLENTKELTPSTAAAVTIIQHLTRIYILHGSSLSSCIHLPRAPPAYAQSFPVVTLCVSCFCSTPLRFSFLVSGLPVAPPLLNATLSAWTTVCYLIVPQVDSLPFFPPSYCSHVTYGRKAIRVPRSLLCYLMCCIHPKERPVSWCDTAFPPRRPPLGCRG